MTHAAPPSPPPAALAAALLGVIALLPILSLFSAMALTPALLIVAGLLVAHLGLGRLRGAIAARPRAEWAIFLAALAWPLLSAVWSITPAVSLLTALRVDALMLIGAAAMICTRHVAIPARATLLLSMAVCLCTALLISEVIPGGGIIRWAHAALGLDYARFIDKNINRGLCALVLLTWLAVAALQGAGHRRAAQVLPFVFALTVLGFDSLSAQVAIFLSIAVFYAVLMAPNAMPRLLSVLIPAVLLAWPLAFPFLDRAFFSTPDIYANLPDTAQHRVEIWRFVSERIAEHPWLGWGMDTSRAMPGGDVVYFGERKYLPLHPHNSAFQILLELGVVGFGLAVSCIALALRRWAQPLDTPAHRQAIAAALIVSFLSVGFTAFGVWQYWWIAAGWLAAVVWRVQRS